MSSPVSLAPNEYIYVLDGNTNVCRLVVGPLQFVPSNNEEVVLGRQLMHVVPVGHFCKILNPVARDSNGDPILEAHGSARILLGHIEYRFASLAPFPLYPGELLDGSGNQPLQVVERHTALRLAAVLDFTDEQGIERNAGDEWLFIGPGTLQPRPEVEVVGDVVRSELILPGKALRLRARTATKDSEGKKRLANEEWLVRQPGRYLPGVDEIVVKQVDAQVLTTTKAIKLRALRGFKDVYGVEHMANEEWLVTCDKTDMHIPDVHEEVVCPVYITTMSRMQYCVVINPVDARGVRHIGKRELRRGPGSFFLQPEEVLETGAVQDTLVLTEHEALLLRAMEAFEEEVEADDAAAAADGASAKPAAAGKVTRVRREAGACWMVRGPTDFVPRVEVAVLERRARIPLNNNEGIYVRNVKTGAVRIVRGEAYMLQAEEVLWEKELPPVVERVLQQEDDRRRGTDAPRDKTRAVSYPVPHNCAVQIYDFKSKVSRVIFGPALAMLEPDEIFTLLNLSGGKPKVERHTQTFSIFLSHCNITDIISVETSDHARLELRLSFDRHFEFDRKKPEEVERLFAVNDYVGDVCKAVSSRVRGAVASTPFDRFHKHSDEVIRASVFGRDENGNIRSRLYFPTNGFVITAVDIQSIDPVDERTRKMLQKSVQLAIEITTQSQERAARHEAETEEQISRGELERQRISDEADAESLRANLLDLRAQSNAVETTGKSIAESKGRAEALRIEGETEVQLAQLRCDAEETEAKAEFDNLREQRKLEIEYTKRRNELEMQRALQTAAVEVQKFEAMVQQLGPETLQAIAMAGPEMQAKLLAGLGFTGLPAGPDSPLALFASPGGLISSGPYVPQ